MRRTWPDKLLRFIALMPEAREAVGWRGRERGEQQFDEPVVIGQYLAVMADSDPIRLAQVARLASTDAR